MVVTNPTPMPQTGKYMFTPLTKAMQGIKIANMFVQNKNIDKSHIKINATGQTFDFIKENCKKCKYIHLGTYILYDQYPHNTFRFGRTLISSEKKRNTKQSKIKSNEDNNKNGTNNNGGVNSNNNSNNNNNNFNNNNNNVVNSNNNNNNNNNNTNNTNNIDIDVDINDEIEEPNIERDQQQTEDECFITTSSVKFLGFRCDLLSLGYCATEEKKMNGEFVIKCIEPYLVAGVDCVMAPLWQSSQSQSASLLNLFYHNLLSNKYKNKAEALRQTMLDIRKQNKQSRKVNDWATFSLYGFAI